MAELAMKEIIFFLFGGLALLLFGLKFMTDALQLVAGDQMRSILVKGTKNPIRGVFTGFLVTALIQSSGATTVLTVGLVNAGLLTLRQAIGVIMGANIGSIIIVYLIGFNLQIYALPIIALGALLFLFIKRQKVHLAGQALLGFGILLYGLTVMANGMAQLNQSSLYASFINQVDANSLWGVAAGIIFTGVIQASSATIGILQQLTTEGVMNYYQAIPILLGANIGTTITALLASIGTSVAARRTALTHFLFNIIGAVIMLPLFMAGLFVPLVKLITNCLPGITWEAVNIKLQLAQAHALFNIGTTIVLLPLVAVLAMVVVKLIPERQQLEDDDASRYVYIHKRFLTSPGVAMEQAMRETIRMGRLAARTFNYAMEYFNHRGGENKSYGLNLEETVNRLQRDITDYVVLASQKQLTIEDSNKSYIILQVLSDLERIGDHSINIIEQADYADQNQVTFSGEAKEELARLIKVTEENLALTMVVLDKRDKDIARQVIELDKQADQLQEECRKAHIRRLNEMKCNGNNGAVFLDVVAHLGRISNHCRNIARYVLEEDIPA